MNPKETLIKELMAAISKFQTATGTLPTKVEVDHVLMDKVGEANREAVMTGIRVETKS